MTILKDFECYIPSKHYARSPITKLAIGEFYYIKKLSEKDYNKILYQQRKNKKKFSILKIVNGTLIYRSK